MKRGWYGESYRHRLARYGIKTSGLNHEELKQRHDALMNERRKKKKNKSFIDKEKKGRYRIYVKREGETEYIPTDIYFDNEKDAETFAGIESVAGMGEDYKVEKVR